MKICVVTDNYFLYDTMLEIINENNYGCDFVFFCSKMNKPSPLKGIIPDIRLKDKDLSFFKSYDLFLSLHCKQLFPDELVNTVRCVNVHPGLNPYNRGWFPQVFAIMNKLPHGATIHEIDNKLDHGAIIVQERVEIHSWSTSYSVYTEVQNAEARLLKANLSDIISNNYKRKIPDIEGNINYLKDFKALCEINLEETITWAEAIDRLRALSFRGYKNAFFYDKDGEKIYLSLDLDKGKVGGAKFEVASKEWRAAS